MVAAWLCVLAGLSAVMAAAWICQALSRNIGWVDVFWTLGTAAAGVILALAWPHAGASSPRRLMICAIVAVWSVRLGVHLIRRVARSPEDGRYLELRAQWGAALQPRLLGFLQLQALVAAVLAAAIALAANRPGPLGLQDALGLVIALTALSGEAAADRQMKAFAADPSNHGAVCDRGLWAWSRHPNYVFEWLWWFTFPVVALRASGGDGSGWWTLLAPALMFLVLRFGTGVPPLETHMLRTRGARFQAYQARVPIFLPHPFRARERATP
jgi:steroid 5-alpha reductase family enzyme